MDYHIESMTQDESGIVCEFSYGGQEYEAVMDDYDGESYGITIYRGYDPDFVHLDYTGLVNEEGMKKCVRDFIAAIEDGWTWS
jgi:hypothetical protein